MGNPPLAQKGNFLHIFDFRVKPGTGDEFLRLFQEFDQSRKNPFHESGAQVTDGVLCRDDQDPNHFYLIAEWKVKDAHRALLKRVKEDIRPPYFQFIEGDFDPIYADVVA